MKNIFLVTLLFFMNGCGYTSVYKNLNNKDLQITIFEMEGNREINNFIKNEINLYSNKNSIDKYDVTLVTKYNRSVIAKNASGVATDYELSVSGIFTVYINEKSKKIPFNESINIKNQTDSFEQNLYENNVKKNFATRIREKLISEIINFK